MNDSFSQSTSFTLDKAHFVECFQQSVPPVQTKDYRKAAIITFMGIALMFVKSEHYYVAYFLVALGIVEVLSVQYRQTWWVWRQLLGKSAQGQVTLTIDHKGITTQSEYINSQILWNDIKSIEQTPLGILLRHQEGVNYLSNSYLNEDMIDFIFQHQRVE